MLFHVILTWDEGLKNKWRVPQFALCFEIGVEMQTGVFRN